MAYDIAAKVLIERCRDEILRRFLGIPVTESTLLADLPQETVSLRRSDFPILVTEADGRQRLVLIEVQSRWEGRFPLRLLEYRCRHKLKYDVEAVSCLLLLRPAMAATDHYQDEEVDYRYRLVRVYELEAAAIVGEPVINLLPLVPLMRRGLEFSAAADRLIYQSALSSEMKGEMLTTMAVLAGLVSDQLPRELLARRRDLMIESVTYDLIKREGLLEGLERGRQEGMEKGMEKGMELGRQEGLWSGLLEAIAFGLDLRFGPAGLRLLPEISRIQDINRLREIQERLKTAQSPEELRLTCQPV